VIIVVVILMSVITSSGTSSVNYSMWYLSLIKLSKTT
jgi:hypothetical protein